MLRIAVAGAAGRMGRTLSRIVHESEGVALAGGLEAEGSGHVGEDMGTLAGLGDIGARITDDPLELLRQVDAVLDFTTPAASLAVADLAAQTRIVHVIGTTGFTADDEARIQAAARHARIVKSGNMSLGVNLLAALVRQAAQALGEDFDIEIVEMHHRHKVDAPSGTALMLGQAAAEGRGVALDKFSERGRDGITGARAPGAIGFASLRGGDIVGEHDVLFAGAGERVVLRHIATDRAIFARGALRAGLWGLDRKPGVYGMADVLGF